MIVGILLIMVAYLLGSIPSAYLVGRFLRHVDIRRVGSKNPGALNTYRQLGKVVGLGVLIADAGKGALAIYLAKWLSGSGWPMDVAAVAVLVGHNWSAYLRFTGGKGLAVLLGLSLAIMPLLTLLTILFTLAMLLVTRRVVVSFVVGIIFLNGLVIGTQQPGSQIVVCLVLSLLVGGTHFYRARPALLTALRDRRWGDVLATE